MTTYTLTFLDETLLYLSPDGEDYGLPPLSITHKVRDVVGCALTDQRPSDATQIVWSAGMGGLLTDLAGRDWKYAVKR